MAKTNQRGRNNNNPTGKNQYSNGWTDTARDHPFAAAAAVGAATAAGVFLWSRRNQISDQLNHLSEQVGEWRESMMGSDRELEMAGGDSFMASGSAGATTNTGSTSAKRSSGTSRSRSSKSTTSRSTRGATGMSETGGGNAMLGRQTGGGGMSTTPSGRGRS